jgi:hypothetical protein
MLALGKPGSFLSKIGCAAPPMVAAPVRFGLAAGISAAITFSGGPAHAERVSVVETSLGLAEQTRLLRHLGLRVGSGDDFVEAHFGPSGTNSSY